MIVVKKEEKPCIICGRMDLKHKARGECVRCYNRTWMKEKYLPKKREEKIKLSSGVVKISSDSLTPGLMPKVKFKKNVLKGGFLFPLSTED